MGVVQAVTAHVAGHNASSFAKAYPGGATPAQLGAVCGYAGKASSALRAHVARGLGQGTKQQGITRYPQLGYSAWCGLLSVAERTAQATTAQQAQAQRAKAAKLWAAARKGGKQAKQQATAQATAQEPTAQA